jgi:hypothetical protein
MRENTAAVADNLPIQDAGNPSTGIRRMPAQGCHTINRITFRTAMISIIWGSI